jgi:hypothetical protein
LRWLMTIGKRWWAAPSEEPNVRLLLLIVYRAMDKRVLDAVVESVCDGAVAFEPVDAALDSAAACRFRVERRWPTAPLIPSCAGWHPDRPWTGWWLEPIHRRPRPVPVRNRHRTVGRWRRRSDAENSAETVGVTEGRIVCL